jgi:hypothetical protein
VSTLNPTRSNVIFNIVVTSDSSFTTKIFFFSRNGCDVLARLYLDKIGYYDLQPNWTHFDRTTTVSILKQKVEGVGVVWVAMCLECGQKYPKGKLSTIDESNSNSIGVV